jgi:hypothetical protein
VNYLFYIELIALSFFCLLGVLPAGLAIDLLVGHLFSNADTKPELKIARVICFGFLWSLACFGVAFVFINYGFVPNEIWSGLYLIAGFLLLLFALKKNKSKGLNIFNNIFIKYLFIVFLAAIALQFCSIIYFPHVLDSTQLGWTNRFTDPLSRNYGEMNGAVAYSGLIFFQGLLAPQLPLAVSAASTKLLLYFLALLACIYISRVFYKGHFRLGIIVSFVIIFGSSLGAIMFSCGKDSLMAVLLVIFYLCTLSDKTLEDDYRTSSLFCGVAACTGVISVPFLAFAALWAFLANPIFRTKLKFAYSHLLIAGPLVAFAAHAMANIPFWYVALGLPIMGFLLFGFAKLAFWKNIIDLKIPFWVPVILLFFSILAGFYVLPFRLEFHNFTAPFLEPLDGKTGYIGFIYNYNPNAGLITTIYLLAPFLALWIWRRENPASWSPFIFLPITLAAFLLLCKSSFDLVNAPSQWTLIKNCINYFLPPVAAIVLGPACELLPKTWDNIKGAALLLGLFFSGAALESLAKFHTKTGIFYIPQRNGVIQTKNKDISFLANYLWEKNKKVRLLVDASTGFEAVEEFSYFSPRTEFMIEENGVYKSSAALEDILKIALNECLKDNDIAMIILTNKTAAEQLEISDPRKFKISALINHNLVLVNIGDH